MTPALINARATFRANGLVTGCTILRVWEVADNGVRHHALVLLDDGSMQERALVTLTLTEPVTVPTTEPEPDTEPEPFGDCRTCVHARRLACRVYPKTAEHQGWTDNHLQADLMTRKPGSPPCPAYTPRTA